MEKEASKSPLKALDINQKDDRGLTPLHRAIHANDTNLFNELLEAGANPNLANTQEFTPLMMAVSEGNTYMIRYLLEKGAAINAFNEYGNTALHEAIMHSYHGYQEEVIQILLNAGANLEIENNERLTPWLYAVCMDRIDVVRKFLELEINVNVTNTKGNSALIIAAKEHNKGIVQLLLSKGADSNLKNDQGSTPLMYAATTPLHNSAYKAMKAVYVDIMRELLNANADVNALDQDGNTVLHTAAWADEDGNAVQLLLDAGADANIASKSGHTPLHRAVGGENITTIHKLLKAGANVDAKCQGETPLHMAAPLGDVNIAEALLNHGADVNAVVIEHWTPLLIAIEGKDTEMAQVLINHGACLKFKNDQTILDFPDFMKSAEMKKFIVNTLYKRIDKGYTNKKMEIEEREIAKELAISPEFKGNIELEATLKLFDESSIKIVADILSNMKIEAYKTSIFKEDNDNELEKTYHIKREPQNKVQPEMYTNLSLGEANISENLAHFLGKQDFFNLIQVAEPLKDINDFPNSSHTHAEQENKRFKEDTKEHTIGTHEMSDLSSTVGIDLIGD